ncbi:MAG TPA: hypothetical protein VIY29_11090, partial [Ktedonobacteraceae bacterium]
MSSLPSNSEVSAQVQPSFAENNTWRGLLYGFAPLVMLVMLVVIALAVTALVRQIFASSGFFVVQQAALITLITGLVIALVVYVIAIVLSLRRVAA